MNRDSLLILPIILPLINLPRPISLANIYNRMLNNSGNSGHACLVPHLGKMPLVFSHFRRHWPQN